jgi:hypothetical protein
MFVFFQNRNILILKIIQNGIYKSNKMPTYYPMQEYELIGFEKSTRPRKMYNAIIEHKKNKKKVKIHFGDSTMQNYTDKTGLDAYPHLIHGDKKRRDRSISRHSGFIKKNYYSPGYFSMEYLWD